MVKDDLNFVKKKVLKYSKEKIKFTKINYPNTVLRRAGISEEEAKSEILKLKDLTKVVKQVRTHQGKKEVRYQCYFVYSNNRARMYIINFNSLLRIITIVPLGRRTLKKYKRKLREDLNRLEK